jgi:outer membrane protein TolC
MRQSLIIYYLMLCFIAKPVVAQRIITMEESKRLALTNNISAKNSRLEQEAARQTQLSALTNYFPSISAGGMTWGARDNLVEMNFMGMGLGFLKKGTLGYVNVVQPLFTGGRILNGNRLASLGKEVADQKNQLITDELIVNTEEKYRQIVTLEEKAKTVEEYENLLRSLLRQVEDAQKSGVVMQNDVLKVKLKLSEILLNKSKLDNARKLAKMAFCQYIGLVYDSTLAMQDELRSTDIPLSYYVDKNEAIQKRTEYYLLQKAVEAEKLQSNMKLGEFLPQAAIGVSEMYMKFDDGKGSTHGMIYGAVSVPISGWWSGSHEIQERKIKEEIAANNLGNNTELLALQIEKSWQDLNDSYKQYLLSEESMTQAAENYKVNKDSYQNGLSTLSDLLEAQAARQQAHDQLTDAKANYANKVTEYRQVTGRR